MNNYIIDVLNQGEDVSSNCAFISSLAEHSYCASIMSTSSSITQDEEPAITDLFVNNEHEICNDIDTVINLPIEIGGVNLDGFNYSVPAVSVDCSGESVKLESMWGGLSNDTGTVVEVAATSEDVGGEIINSKGDGSVEAQTDHGIMDGSEMEVAQSLGTIMEARKSKPRRTDFIVDGQKRKNHFDLYFQKIADDFQRIISRTGCKGTLSALFEGNVYDGAAQTNCSSPPTGLQERGSRLADTASESLVSPVGIDDHRYAATMLTQNVSSPAVRDHQYDEKTITSAPESDSMDNEDDDDDAPVETIKCGRKNPKRYRYDYAKIRWERTQIFSKVARTLFSNKIKLAKRTGAAIDLTLTFEGNLFNDENYKNAFDIIAGRRERLKIKKFSISPKTSAPLKPVQTPLQSTSAPLSFYVPSFTSFPFQVPYIMPMPSSTGSDIDACGNFPISFQVPFSQVLSSVSQSADTFPSREIFDNEKDNNLDLNDSNPILTLVDHDRVNASLRQESPTESSNSLMEESGINITTNSTSTSPFIPIPAVESDQDIAENSSTFENRHMQNTPEVAQAYGMNDSATNTEPMCSICCNSDGIPNLQARRERSMTKPFWIRCNDPFCYDMVHASCVGFVVTHSEHLKQLPAFYCKVHR